MFEGRDMVVHDKGGYLEVGQKRSLALLERERGGGGGGAVFLSAVFITFSPYLLVCCRIILGGYCILVDSTN